MDDEDLTKFKKINPKSEVKRLRLTVDEKNQLDDFRKKVKTYLEKILFHSNYLVRFNIEYLLSILRI